MNRPAARRLFYAVESLANGFAVMLRDTWADGKKLIAWYACEGDAEGLARGLAKGNDDGEEVNKRSGYIPPWLRRGRVRLEHAEA